MALLDDFNHSVENTVFRQKVAIAVTRRVMQVMGGSPTAPQQALAKRFMLAPGSEVERYTLPTAAHLSNNGMPIVSASDSQIQSAVDAVLTVNVALGIQ